MKSLINMVVFIRALHAHAESPATYVTLLTGHYVHLSRGFHGVVVGTVEPPRPPLTTSPLLTSSRVTSSSIQLRAVLTHSPRLS